MAAAAAPSAAQRHFELALELWEQVPGAAEEVGIDHAQLLENAAVAASAAGAPDRALALVEQSQAELGAQAGPERTATLQARRAQCLLDVGREAEGISVVEQVLSLLPEQLSSHAAAHVLTSLARAMLRLDQLGRAGELARRALAAAQAAGAVEDQLDAQMTLGHSLVYAGDVERGLALTVQTRDAARTAGLSLVAARACIDLSDLVLMLGRYDQAVDTADEGLVVAERAGISRTVGAFLRGNKGGGAAALRALDDAWSPPRRAPKPAAYSRRRCCCCAPSFTRIGVTAARPRPTSRRRGGICATPGVRNGLCHWRPSRRSSPFRGAAGAGLRDCRPCATRERPDEEAASSLAGDVARGAHRD